MKMTTTRRWLLLAPSSCGARRAAGRAASDATRDGADVTVVALRRRQLAMTIPGLKPGRGARAPSAPAWSPTDMMQIWRQEPGRGALGLLEAEAAAALPARRARGCTRQRSAGRRRGPADEVHRARPDALEARGEEVDRRGLQGLPQRQGARRHHRHLLRHVPSRRQPTRIPETYPKYQCSSKKVALLRDMINWCIENPLKGKPLAGERPDACARWRPTSSPPARAWLWSRASTEA